jgi:hypothetical protein
MKNKIKLSDSDKRLLIIFLAIVIIACSYFFIFSKEMSKAEDLEASNTTDSATVQQMEQMEAGLPTVRKNIKNLKAKEKKIIGNYPSDMKTEKVIETLQAIEDDNEGDFHISEITFLMNNPIVTATDADTAGDGSTTDTSSDTTTSTESTETAESTEAAEDTTDDSAPASQPVSGYYASIGIKYTASYLGLKDMINYVNEFKDRTTITNFSAIYDSSTGGVTGEMTLNMYYLMNTGKDYVPPIFDYMQKGTDNIFGGTAD